MGKKPTWVSDGGTVPWARAQGSPPAASPWQDPEPFSLPPGPPKPPLTSFCPSTAWRPPCCIPASPIPSHPRGSCMSTGA